ncbi:MAG: class I SAM-dependent methyltransferase [Betaproteobacteria bacterium]|nr:class I SAM-dependent methyltransferase [Betaproteobacteria bacterium]
MLSRLLGAAQPVDVSKMRTANSLQSQNEIELVKLKGIQEKSGWKDVPACPVCGSARRQGEFSKHGVELMPCIDCTARYGAQVAANLDDVYQNPAYTVFTKEDTDEHYAYRRERFGRERVGILEKYCGDLTDKRLLDVGCGNGYFLAEAMRKCRHCYGAEFSEKLRAYAQARTGLPIFRERLDDLPERGFDIITLFDVIEHVPEPLPFLASVDRLLNPGGHVLVFTPNFDSFGLRVMREYSSIVDPTEHVILFTEQSLRALGARVGFKVVYYETQGLDVDNILAKQQYLGQPRDAFLLEWRDALQAMINAAECGDYARIMYRKA